MTELEAPYHCAEDKVCLAVLDLDDREKFFKWMDELDAEHVKAGSPYGDGTLWKLTGAMVWFDYFSDEMSAADALSEDLSFAD